MNNTHHSGYLNGWGLAQLYIGPDSFNVGLKILSNFYPTRREARAAKKFMKACNMKGLRVIKTKLEVTGRE